MELDTEWPEGDAMISATDLWLEQRYRRAGRPAFENDKRWRMHEQRVNEACRRRDRGRLRSVLRAYAKNAAQTFRRAALMEVEA